MRKDIRVSILALMKVIENFESEIAFYEARKDENAYYKQRIESIKKDMESVNKSIKELEDIRRDYPF
jgi:uncharacterized protein YydD (DUF2326 family)